MFLTVKDREIFFPIYGKQMTSVKLKFITKVNYEIIVETNNVQISRGVFKNGR